MKTIIITAEKPLKNEFKYIEAILDEGIDNIQIRKPLSIDNSIRLILDNIKEEYHSRIILNGRFSLIDTYKNIGGIHANSRNNIIPENFKGIKGYSCHTIKEVESKKEIFDYMFLSPIYDSISKEGYKANFSFTELKDATKEGIISEKVYALGGITPDKIPQIKDLGFGGVVFMGYIWNSSDINEIIRKIKLIKSYI
ncbi:MAG: thiamine phosphate synthase [Bacteroidales bacterium]|nr:thiamine phosphate synthase [Bacteroidales bacterium]